VLIDNSYRKLGNLHDAWTKGFTGVKFVENIRAGGGAVAG
jgi:exopolysaccharide biosynthesis predicted pyruvyltransferase EpsI